MSIENDLTTFNVIAVLVAYILGSIPTALWIGKRFYGIDIREHGSKNAGATNTFRVLGKKAGIPVLIIDVLKGFLAVKLAATFSAYDYDTNPLVNFKIVIGAAAVLGHVFPIFADFKGGKGVATTLGVVMGMHWQSALLSLSIFLVVFLISKYVSLGSIISAVCYPFILVWGFHTSTTSMIYFSMVVTVLILVTHQKNIERLAKGQENRMNLKKNRHKN